ncbi:MAG: NADPH-dependent FMN reductase [Cyclobacteriaceae bacterium]
MRKLKVLAISGSIRKNSSNENILKGIDVMYRDQIAMSFFDGIDKLPHFNPDIDNDNLPAVVSSFRKQISEADGVLFCTPEYVFSIPGSLKNAIEWNVSTTLFSGKPVAIIVAAASGEKAFESLKLVLTTIESTIGPRSSLLIKGAKGKVRDGVIQEETLANLKILMDDFIGIMKRPANTPTKYN